MNHINESELDDILEEFDQNRTWKWPKLHPLAGPTSKTMCVNSSFFFFVFVQTLFSVLFFVLVRIGSFVRIDVLD